MADIVTAQTAITETSQDGHEHTKSFLTSIFDQLSTINPEDDDHIYAEAPKLSNLTGDTAKNAKAIFLTLHFLFPHELLPALDLLDRKLVNKHQQQMTGLEVYYVQSASSLTDTASRSKSRFRNAFNPTKTYYEVRLDSWNCSCAAFAQSSLKLILSRTAGSDDEPISEWKQTTSIASGLMVGGGLTHQDSPVAICKHVLAVVVGECCPGMFSNSVNIVDDTWNSMAGWAAGFGEI